MKKLFLIATLGVAGFASAQTIIGHGCGEKGCNFTYVSTCDKTKEFSTEGGDLTLTEAFIMANIYNVQLCGTRVEEVTIKYD